MIERVDRRPTLMWLCYGRDDIYEQAAFSLLSLLHVCGGEAPRGVRLVVYCDRPGIFAALPVQEVVLTRETLDGWLGGSDYVHRRKTCAIIDALERFGGAVMFVDTDTWFRRPPASLLRRIAPGRVLFHICEGFVTATGMPVDQALAAQLARGDYRLRPDTSVAFGPRTLMWNTGVVGVHPTDLPRMRDALGLADQIWARADPRGAYGKKIHHAEQFATGYAFHDAHIGEAVRSVYHYWLPEMKAAFAAKLPGLVLQGLADPSPGTLARLYRDRPRDTGLRAWQDALKMQVRATTRRFGIAVPGPRRSV